MVIFSCSRIRFQKFLGTQQVASLHAISEGTNISILQVQASAYSSEDDTSPHAKSPCIRRSVSTLEDPTLCYSAYMIPVHSGCNITLAPCLYCSRLHTVQPPLQSSYTVPFSVQVWFVTQYQDTVLFYKWLILEIFLSLFVNRISVSVCM